MRGKNVRPTEKEGVIIFVTLNVRVHPCKHNEV